MSLFSPALMEPPPMQFKVASADRIVLYALSLLYTGCIRDKYSDRLHQFVNIESRFRHYVGWGEAKLKELGVSAWITNLAISDRIFSWALIVQTMKRIECHQQANEDGFITNIIHDLAEEPTVWETILVCLAFFYDLTSSDSTMQLLDHNHLWSPIVAYLNHLSIENFREPADNVMIRPLPNDFVLRGQRWTEDYLLEIWFSDTDTDDKEPALAEDRALELLSTSPWISHLLLPPVYSSLGSFCFCLENQSQASDRRSISSMAMMTLKEETTFNTANKSPDHIFLGDPRHLLDFRTIFKTIRNVLMDLTRFQSLLALRTGYSFGSMLSVFQLRL